jgi:hypothetical protein
MAGAAAWSGDAQVPARREEGVPCFEHGGGDDGEHRGRQGDPPDVPALQHDRRALRGQGAEFAEQVPRVPFHEGAQLGRAGHPAGGGERLAELGRAEVAQRPLVHPVRVTADG